jgi:acyl-CoA thioesterase-1
VRDGFRRAGAAVLCVCAVLAGVRSEAGTSAAVGVLGAASVAAATVTAATVPKPPLRIMPLGASSTVGAGSPGTAGYRGPLQELLARDGIAVDLVGSQRQAPPSVPDGDHEGYGGATLADLTPLVDGWVRRERPEVVLLHAGTNDLLRGATAQTAARRLDVLLDTICEASNAHVVVAGVWAPLPAQARARARFDTLAAAVVLGHRALGHPVRYVDTSALLGPADLADGLHANRAGYHKIARMWERQIRAHLGRR